MQYAWGVRRGEIVACRYVKLAVERHFRDLETGAQRGLWFDYAAAEHAIGFFRFLRHSKGEWAGQELVLEPWQQFYLWCLFGWKEQVDGTRRFRDGYLEVARKNGKTTLAAGIGLYLMVADDEPGAEVFAAATKRDQAGKDGCHGEGTRMVEASPALSARITVFRNNLHIQGTASKFEPLGRDSKSLDGLNIHGLIKDEVHEWKDRDFNAKLDTAQGSRRQPLSFSITTAGTSRVSICYEERERLIKVLEGLEEDDSLFGLIYTMDEGDDWENEAVWSKANPNLGVSVKLNYLQKKVAKAKSMPSQINQVLRYHFSLWTQAESRWLDPEAWKSCGLVVVAEEELAGRECCGALDLSSTIDLSGWALVFPPLEEDEPYKVLVRLFCPADNIAARSKRDRVPYEAWVKAGLLTPTPGAAIDYTFIRKQVNDDAAKFQITEIAYDRWGASKLRQDLEEDGHTMIEFGQGFASMSPPTKELERLVLSGLLAHGGNPALAWMAANVVIRTDPAGNIKPDKEKSIEKIDGIVAVIMALDRAQKHPCERDTEIKWA
jgi:phage terminase large subunit-like protein